MQLALAALVPPARVSVSLSADWTDAKFCEPVPDPCHPPPPPPGAVRSQPGPTGSCGPPLEQVLKANSSQGFTAAVAGELGMRSKPLRIYRRGPHGSRRLQPPAVALDQEPRPAWALRRDCGVSGL